MVYYRGLVTDHRPLVCLQLIVKCRLLGRILEAWDDNEQKQTKPKGVRQGYMGHLINIANNVAAECERRPELGSFIAAAVTSDTQLAWDKFVKGPLAESNRQQQLVLGGMHPSNLSGDDANDDYNMQATIFQQQIQYDFQLQQMNAPDLIENYSFRDGDFGDPDNCSDQLQLHSTLDRLVGRVHSYRKGPARITHFGRSCVTARCGCCYSFLVSSVRQ